MFECYNLSFNIDTCLVLKYYLWSLNQTSVRSGAPTFVSTRSLFSFLWRLIYAMSYKRVFGAKKSERSPRENPPKGDFVAFSHGDLSPRQSKIRQTVAEYATHRMLRTFVWRGERSPCENTKKSSFGGFSRGDLSRFRPCLSYLCLAGRNSPLFVVSLPGGAKGRHAKTRKSHHLAGFRVATFRVFAPFCCIFASRGERSPCENTKTRQMVILAGFHLATFRPARQRYDKQEAKGDAWKVSYFCVAGRKIAMRKHEKVTIWRVFAWRLFAFSPRKHDNTTWHKSATIVHHVCILLIDAKSSTFTVDL